MTRFSFVKSSMVQARRRFEFILYIIFIDRLVLEIEFRSRKVKIFGPYTSEIRALIGNIMVIKILCQIFKAKFKISLFNGSQIASLLPPLHKIINKTQHFYNLGCRIRSLFVKSYVGIMNER